MTDSYTCNPCKFLVELTLEQRKMFTSIEFYSPLKKTILRLSSVFNSKSFLIDTLQ